MVFCKIWHLSPAMKQLALCTHLRSHHHRHDVCAASRVPAEKLVMVGDRYMTDIVFGNRLGMLTIRPEPFTWSGEPQTVKLVRANPAMPHPACASCDRRMCWTPRHSYSSPHVFQRQVVAAHWLDLLLECLHAGAPATLRDVLAMFATARAGCIGRGGTLGSRAALWGRLLTQSRRVEERYVRQWVRRGVKVTATSPARPACTGSSDVTRGPCCQRCPPALGSRPPA